MSTIVYTVYKITNVLNDKYYIGKHKTINPMDTYYGSGRAIKAAIKKHGKHNFRKEVLLITDSEQEAFDFERQLTQDFVLRNTYNMRLGGPGGFTAEARSKGASKLTDDTRRAGGKSAAAKKSGAHALTPEQHASNGSKGGKANAGKPKSDAHKQAMREAYYRRIAQR